MIRLICFLVCFFSATALAQEPAAAPAAEQAGIVDQLATNRLAASADDRTRSNARRLRDAIEQVAALEVAIDNVCADSAADCEEGLRQKVQGLWDEIAAIDTAITSNGSDIRALGERLDTVEETLNNECGDGSSKDCVPGLTFQVRALTQRVTDVERDVAAQGQALYGYNGTPAQPTGGLVSRESYGLLGLSFAADLARPALSGVYGGNLASACLMAAAGRENGLLGFQAVVNGCLGSAQSYSTPFSFVVYYDGVVELGGGVGFGASFVRNEAGHYKGKAFSPRLVGHVGFEAGLIQLGLSPYLETSFGIDEVGNTQSTYGEFGTYTSLGFTASATVRISPN